MGVQGKTLSSTSYLNRAKVYLLNDDGKWNDRGTGHVAVDTLERSEELGLFVIDEEDNEALLVHRIRSDEIYRRQEDTIISWRDPEYSTELALSFQESTGCSYIWEQICSVQRDHEIGPRPMTETLETSGASQANDETFLGVNSTLRELPAVDLSTLPSILKAVVENGIADQMRVTELILHDHDFFQKLMELFRICEDLENFEGLHTIFKLVKGIILLNSSQVFEKIFGDELIMDIIGSLEYDPDVPHVQHHRDFLKEHVIFKEAIPIKDLVVLSRIHQTYRIGYLKDVILPRALDEATVANLNCIIHANNAVVVSLLKDDNTFIQELFTRMRSSTTTAKSKKNLMFFLHEFCSLSKSLQLVQQLRLFRDLMNEGIFDIISDAMQSLDKRLVLTGTDILILFMNLDPNLLRSYVIRQEGNLLLGILVKGMLTDFGEDMHCQFHEILRNLLDSYPMAGPQRDTIIEIFYEKHLDQLIDVITSSCPPNGVARSINKSASSRGRVENQAITKPEILSNICELLCFCVLHHSYRIKCNFLLNNVIEKILFLTHRREKYLVVAAVRFMRTLISHNDENLLCHIAKKNLLKPIVEAFVCNGNRYNLLNSAVLELLEYIQKGNLKTLILHLVDTFWTQLAKFNYLAPIHALEVKYEQLKENCEMRCSINSVNLRKRIDERALEKEEEHYFNESDEEDTASARASHTSNEQAQPILANGASVSYPLLRPGSGGLVDYDDDDDDEDYNPPKRMPETSGDDSTVDASPKSKRKMISGEELELTKKHRLDKKNSEDGVIASASSPTIRAAVPSNKSMSTTHSLLCSADEDSRSDQGGKEPTAPRSCSKCSSLDARQSSGEDCPLKHLNGNNSSEMGVNGGKITGSEPYSVR